MNSTAEASHDEAIGKRSSSRRTVLAWGVVVLFVTCLIVVVWFVPEALARHDVGSVRYTQLNAAERSKAVSDIRSTILQAVGAMAVGAAGIVGWRQLAVSRDQVLLGSQQLVATIASNRAQEDLARESLVSQTLTTCVEQLGNERTAVRVGGIYGLELIASSSPDRGRLVMEILCAFVRGTSSQPLEGAGTELLPLVLWTASLLEEPSLGVREPDRQAALRVLGRLTTGPLADEELFDRTDRRLLDFERAGLLRSNLTLGRFEGADFNFCDLRGSNLSGGSFDSATFVWATLAGANLAGSDLLLANFAEADLRQADFTGANLRGAIFDRANVLGAIFDRSDLGHVDMTTVDGGHGASFRAVTINSSSRLPVDNSS